MYSTGAITLITEKLIGRPKTLLSAQLRILPPVAVGSAFLNNTPLVAMFIPVIRDLARTCRLPAEKLYIPLSYSSILGGTCTLIGTSTNLVVAGLVLELLGKNSPDAPPVREVGMFDLTMVGVPLTVAGILFMVLTSGFLLPTRKRDIGRKVRKRTYGVELGVVEGSRLIGKTLAEMGYTEPVGFELVEIRREDAPEVELEPAQRLRSDDILVFSAELDAIPELWGTEGLEPIHGNEIRELTQARFSNRLVEVVVSRRSIAVGRQIKEMPLRDDPIKGAIIALSRGGKRVEEPMEETRIRAGDIGVLEVEGSFFRFEDLDEEFATVRRLTGARIKRYDRAAAASLITVAMVVVVALGWMSMLNAAALAAGAMILTGCLSLRGAERSVDFSTLIIIASAIGLESSVTGSGLSSKIAETLSLIGGDNPYVALTVVFLGCILMDTMATNIASAVFMFPIAMSMAASLGVDGMPFVIVVMVGASCSFISPMGYQTNLMVYRPGGYRFVDFVRIGVPLTMLVGVITIWLTPLLWSF
jgi:di/tricarboxylate transporter